MRFPTYSFLAAFAAAALISPAVKADPVSVGFGTTGTFNGTTDTSYDAGGGNIISFNGLGFKTIDLDTTTMPTSFTSFGSFDTSLFLANPGIDFTVSFTLSIQQLFPAPAGSDTLTFLGSITGTLSGSSSGLVLTFDAPLTQSISGAGGYDVAYHIVSADAGPGSLAISPASSGAQTTLQGQVTVSPAVPEPSTFVLAGLAIPVVLMARRRVARTA